MTTILPTEHITAMKKALRKAKTFTLEITRDTLVATHTPSGREVVRALRGSGGWITRIEDGLFQ